MTTRLDILTDALTIVARLVMASRTDRDAAAIVHQLRAMGPAQRADVGSIEDAARERLRQQREAGDVLWGPPDGEGD